MLVLKSFFWRRGLQYFISASTGIQLSQDVTESESHSTALITSTVSADVPFQQVQICLQNVQLWGRNSSFSSGKSLLSSFWIYVWIWKYICYLLISHPGSSSPGSHLYQNINNDALPAINKWCCFHHSLYFPFISLQWANFPNSSIKP